MKKEAMDYVFYLLDESSIDFYWSFLKSSKSYESLKFITALFHHILYLVEPTEDETKYIENSEILKIIVDLYMDILTDFTSSYSSNDLSTDNQLLRLNVQTVDARSKLSINDMK